MMYGHRWDPTTGNKVYTDVVADSTVTVLNSTDGNEVVSYVTPVKIMLLSCCVEGCEEAVLARARSAGRK